MTFKDIKQNYPVYILDKQELKVTQGKAVSVSFPHSNLDVTKMPVGTAVPQMVVDIAIEADGKTATYSIPENLSVTYAGNIVLSVDRDGLAREVEAMKAAAEQVLASMDRQKEIVDKSAALLSELNPVYKEKVETDARFNTIEKKVSEMSSMLEKFIKEFKG